MVVFRKDKQSFVAKNLTFLRQKKKKTLKEMADLLTLKSKSSYKAYEEGRALPDIHKIMKLASYFDVSVEELIYKDIENTKKKKQSSNKIYYEIEKVPVAATAGYARSFGDSQFLQSLPKEKIPFKPYGIARVFDISGDSMEPEISNGCSVIGIKIGRSELKDNRAYIVVTSEGVQCKYLRFESKSDFIYLISENAKYPPRHLNKSDIKELWEVWKIL